MQKMSLDEYRKYMTSSCNIGKCENCPENRDMRNVSQNILPCGQYHCEIRLGCRQD